MKTKPILIAIAGIILFAGLIIFIRSRSTVKLEKTEIGEFLAAFSLRVSAGNPDTILTYFASNKRTKPIKRLVSLLAGKKSLDGIEKPLASIALDVDNADIKVVNPKLAIASVPVKLSHDSLDSKQSVLIMKVYKIGVHKFKIVQADVKKLYEDYVAYDEYVRRKTLTDKEIYEPITLAAFKTADSLKAKYDSVIWFSHIKDKTYFYVVKGKWDFYRDLMRDSTRSYRMGLVGPDQKEIIPPEFDLVGAIGGTFENLIEVEKDHNRGLYDITGKNIVPVTYDQIFPISTGEDLAILKSGNAFYRLRKDLTISESVNLKIADIIPTLNHTASFTINNNPTGDITEFNSREENGSIYLPPSYLVDLKIISPVEVFKNPMRHHIEWFDVSNGYEVVASNNQAIHAENNNWFESIGYAIRNYFIGGRSEFYDERNIVVMDKKRNKVYSAKIDINYNPYDGGEALSSDGCNDNTINAINDSLFEVKTTANVVIGLHNEDGISEMPVYHYLQLKGDKLVELNTRRLFSFTKYRKIDETYLNGCYLYNIKQGKGARKSVRKEGLNAETLRYIKNEIYADYHYKFKDSIWTAVFGEVSGDEYKGIHDNVDDSLTVIDKYNINWINNKLKGKQDKRLAVK